MKRDEDLYRVLFITLSLPTFLITVVSVESTIMTYTFSLKKTLRMILKSLHREWARCSKRNGVRTNCDSPSRSKDGPPSRRSFASLIPGCSGYT